MPFHLLNFNCRSIWPRKAEMKQSNLITTADIICLTETWLKPEQRFTFPGFVIYRKDRATSGGGVAVMIKRANKQSDLKVTCRKQEVEVVAVQIEVVRRRINVITIYIPPKQGCTCEDLLEVISPLSGSCIIAGDLNAHSTIWGCESQNQAGKEVERFLAETDFVLLNTGAPTRVAQRGKGSAIDLVLATSDIAEEMRWKSTLETFGSDHMITIVEIRGVTTPRVPVFTTKRGLDLDGFQLELSRKRVKGSQEKQSIEDFTRKVLRAEKGNQKKRIAIGEYTPENKKIQKLSAIRRKQLSRYNHEKTDKSRQMYRKIHDSFRRRVRYLQREAWQNFANHLQARGGEKSIWQVLQGMRKEKSPCEPWEAICLKSKKTEKQIADDFLECFLQEGRESCMKEELRRIYDKEVLEYRPDTMSELEAKFTMRELRIAMSAMKMHSTPGPDGITNLMIRNLPERAQEELLGLYNQIWEEHISPKEWEKTTIIPILKAGKPPEKLASYRPISLTSVLMKLYDRMLKNRIGWKLEKEQYWQAQLHGFRPGRSSIDAVGEIVTDVQDALTRRNVIYAVFFDMEKAFDSVDHSKLLQMLTRIGLGPKMYKYLRQAITKRRAEVKLGKMKSSERKVRKGTPPKEECCPLCCLIYS